jgi:hypothetical protein
MARPKTVSHRRVGKLGILLRILVVIAAIGIFLEWRPLGERVPSASDITASAVQIASDAVSNNQILNSILATTKADGTSSEQQSVGGGGGGNSGDGSDYVDYDNEGGSAEEEEEKNELDNTEINEENTSKLSGSIESSEEDEEIDRRDAQAAKSAAAAAAATAAKSANLPKVDGPFFTCPDGRIGLHVIHMPLLLGQTMEKGAAGVFMAGRMIMFRDFSLPSLARQTNQNFVAYVSYDPDQDSAFTKAAHEALKTQLHSNNNIKDKDSSGNSPAPAAAAAAAFVYIPDNPRYFINKPDKMLAFPRVANVLSENQIVSRKDVKSVSLYITSKMDSDDAVHSDAVRLIQQEACARVGPEESERVLTVRIGNKLAWFPHANTTYGVLAKPSEDIEPDQREIINRQMRSKPHLTSVAVDVSLMLCQSPLNCYTTTGEDDPASIFTELSTTTEDCPYEFHAEKNLFELVIEGAVAGALYSRPPKFGGDQRSIPLGTELSIELLHLDDGYSPIPFNLDAITGCGIVPGELSATNLLLASVYAEAPYVSGLSSSDAQGWGAVGGMVAAPEPPSEHLDDSSADSTSGNDQHQGDGFDEEETAMLDAGGMDDEAGDEGEEQREVNGDYDTES